MAERFAGLGVAVLAVVSAIALVMSGCTEEVSGGDSSAALPGAVASSPVSVNSGVDDPWRSYDVATSGHCVMSGPKSLPLGDVNPVAVAAVNDCAAIVITSSDAWIGSSNDSGLVRFSGISVVSESLAFVARASDGFWLVNSPDGTPDDKQHVWLVTRQGVLNVGLPSDIDGISAIASIGGDLLAAASTTGESSVLLSISSRGKTRRVKSFSGSGLFSVAGAGSGVAVGLSKRDGSELAFSYDGKWGQKWLGSSTDLVGVAIDGDIIAALYNEEDKAQVPVAEGVTISRDRGATWNNYRLVNGYAAQLVGIHDGAIIAVLSVPKSDASVFSLSDTGKWKPVSTPSTQPTDSVISDLAPCGFWFIDTTLFYTPLLGACS